ncbi:MAG: hypothetical protein ACP6KW_08645 [Candidatus Thorarchaeota archaeon]
MDRERYHRIMYIIAALWNWVLAVIFLILPLISMDYFTLLGLVIPNTMLWFDCFAGLVFAFGLGFYFISESTRHNYGLIKVSAFEKTWVFVVGLLFYLTGGASVWVVLIVSGDMIFGLLFIEDYMAIRRAS